MTSATSGMRTIIYPVGDLTTAARFYTSLLGAPPAVDSPYYVGFEVDGHDVGLDPNAAARGITAPIGYWHVPDIAATIDTLVEAGGAVRHQVTDVGGGKLIATLADPDGNDVGLIQVP